MAHLSIACLGTFRVMLDGELVTDFKSNRVRALLIYLAVEAERPHRRETLAGLLWPEWPDREALSNLRFALSDLRRAIGDRTADPPFLLIARDTLQFNNASEYELDVTDFLSGTLPAQDKGAEVRDLGCLEEVVAQYQGDFLEGFSIKDCAEFEEWVLLKRQQFAQVLLSTTRYLAVSYEREGAYEQAEAWARRLIELEPWDETTHQQLMRVLASNNRRSAALVQYETCRRLLADELGVEPSMETKQLYQQIRAGKLDSHRPVPKIQPDLAVAFPRFLQEEPPHVESPVFVGLDSELAQLEEFLGAALAGRGRVAFVTGEAGGGKTALLHEFSRRAQETHPELIVAGGNCNAHTGIGDPYLPFREILGLLTGGVEALLAAGSITLDHARRLWRTLPAAVEALVENGSDLFDTFVSRPHFLERATSCAPEGAEWLGRLVDFLDRKPITSADSLSLSQSDLFEQYTGAMQVLATKGPLLLLLDDLQWADLGSVSLLFHLGRHLGGSRILVVGAYRSEELSIGRSGARHPLAPVVSEFQRDFGDIHVNLSQAERQGFITALLDSEPNRLGAAFHEMLFRQTRGHPLFTIELLRGLQERGDLVKDPEGRWIEGEALNWEKLPARVEAVIAERIARLPEPLQATLRVACIQGETFAAEVVATVQAADGREIVRHLSGELDRRHRLVRVQAIERLGSHRLSRYRFRNFLFQKYLYDGLDDVERAYLHEDVGYALEELYGEQSKQNPALAPQLAWHFQEAGITERAVHYLHQAGRRAVLLSAYREGREQLAQGLALLLALPDSLERTEQECDLQLSLALAWTGEGPGREWENALTRARDLCQQLGKSTQLCRVLGEMAIFNYVRADYRTARQFAEEALSLAEQAGDPMLAILGHWHLGFISFGRGAFVTARAHLREVISYYDPQQHHRSFVELRGSDPGGSALAYDACCLWCLGYPEQAATRGREALALTRELNHAFSLADVLSFGGCQLSVMRRDEIAAKACAEELLHLSKGMGSSSFGRTADCYLVEALDKLGQAQGGLAEIRQALAMRDATEALVGRTCLLSALAEAEARAGEPETGLATLAEALNLAEEYEERFWEAEINRLRADFLLALGDEPGAEASFQKAIEVARRQAAKSWELRSATGLARLWKKQGKRDRARQLLEPIYHWFTEGFDTPDLQEAKRLLEELS